jgi:hypothetical protein
VCLARVSKQDEKKSSPLDREKNSLQSGCKSMSL